MNELELASTSQLIDELMKRKTFAGVLVYDQDACRKSPWKEQRKRLRVRSQNIKGMQIVSLLERVEHFIKGAK